MGFIQGKLEENDEIQGVSKEAILNSMKIHKEKIRAADNLGITRPTLDKYLNEYEIKWHTKWFYTHILAFYIFPTDSLHGKNIGNPLYLNALSAKISLARQLI